jgi:hypothetical protein
MLPPLSDVLIPSFLKDFCGLLLSAEHYGLTEVVWHQCSFLLSTPGADIQPFHYDNPVLAEVKSDGNRISYLDASLSILAALEPNSNPTQLYLKTHDTDVEFKTVTIPHGGFIIFRGDCFHAGAAYEVDNLRLFIATGTEAFVNDGKNVETRTLKQIAIDKAEDEVKLIVPTDVDMDKINNRNVGSSSNSRRKRKVSSV